MQSTRYGLSVWRRSLYNFYGGMAHHIVVLGQVQILNGCIISFWEIWIRTIKRSKSYIYTIVGIYLTLGSFNGAYPIFPFLFLS